MGGNTDIRMMLVLGSLEKLIVNLSSKTFVKSLGMDREDLAQEGRMKVINTFRKYADRRTSDIIKACYTSLSNLYNGFIRKSHFKKNTGIVVDLTEAFHTADPNQVYEIYVSLALGHLRSMLDKDERYILDRMLEVEGPEIIKRKAILDSVEISRKELTTILDKVREYIPVSTQYVVNPSL